MDKLFRKFLIYLYRIRINFIRRKIREILSENEEGFFWSDGVRDIMRIYHNIDVGYGSYGSMFTPGSFKPGTVIGNYCSFSSSVFQYNANHPYSKFTTHPILYHEDYTGSKSEELKRVNLIIGHDVWIGHGVVILPGCSNIGNGAVIGAGSIVTKDVPPYAIVTGNPAKILRMRFTDEIIYKIEESKWWELNKDELIKRKAEFERIVNGQ